MPICVLDVLELVDCLPLPLTPSMFALAPGRKPSTNMIAPQPLSLSDNITSNDNDNDSTIMDIISFAVAVDVVAIAVLVRCDDNILE